MQIFLAIDWNLTQKAVLTIVKTAFLVQILRGCRTRQLKLPTTFGLPLITVLPSKPLSPHPLAAFSYKNHETL
jgi:hypothetical protein